VAGDPAASKHDLKLRLKSRGQSVDVSDMYPEPAQPSYIPISQPEVDLHTTELAGQEQSDLREFVRLLKRNLLLIVFVAIATAAATYFVSSSEPNQYSASTTLLYLPTDSAQDPTRAINTIVGISSSNAVLASVALEQKVTLRVLRSSVTVTGDPNADLIKVSAGSQSAPQAAALANGVAQGLIAYSSTGQKDVLRAQITSLKAQLQAFVGRVDPSAVAAASDLQTQLAEANAQLAVAKP